MLEDFNNVNTPVERAIRRINDEEQRRRRKVRGRDFNDWHTQLREWREAGEHGQSLRLLLEIVAAAETLAQYDSREPRHEWYVWASKDFERLGLIEQAVEILRRWEYHWPAGRECWPSHREKVESRLRRLSRLL